MATVQTTTVSPPAAVGALSKEIGVGPLKSTLSVWISLAILILTFVLHIVAIAITEWVHFPAYSVVSASKQGLWKVCSTSLCLDIPGDDTLRAVRAFAIIALLLMLMAMVITFGIVSSMLKFKDSTQLLCITLIACHAVITLCLMIAFAVYTNRPSQISKAIQIAGLEVHGSYGAGFALEIVCFILELAATIILVLDFFLNRK